MNDNQLEQYSRQIVLPEIDIAGQQRLLDASVLVVGLGALGSPVAMYLASSGIGHLVLNDFDAVESSNLQRQVIHNRRSTGTAKTTSAASTLSELNPDTQISLINQKLSPAELKHQAATVDVVVDCSDNFNAHFAINDACFKQKTPLISGSIEKMKGYVTTFNPKNPKNPCYRCLYDESSLENPENCTNTGVLAPIAGVIGSIQAAEAIKAILDFGSPLVGRLLQFDILNQCFKTSNYRKDPDCRCCTQ